MRYRAARFKFSILAVRVSATQIYKFNVKFERKTIRRSIFFFLLLASARNVLLAVANAVKLNFATRRRGGNDGGEGADWSSVTEADRVSNEV